MIWSQLLELFVTFAKIGLFTFGGGYAMISIIEDICVERKNWITHEDMMNVTVIAESTPGPIAINCATFVGYRQQGIRGAVAATIGMVLPSFVIIFLIAMFFDRFLEIGWVVNAFQGIKIGVGFLILDAGLKMMRKMKKKMLPRVILACAFAAMAFANLAAVRLSSIVLMLVAGLVSLGIFLVKGNEGKGGSGK